VRKTIAILTFSHSDLGDQFVNSQSARTRFWPALTVVRKFLLKRVQSTSHPFKKPKYHRT